MSISTCNKVGIVTAWSMSQSHVAFIQDMGQSKGC